MLNLLEEKPVDENRARSRGRARRLEFEANNFRNVREPEHHDGHSILHISSIVALSRARESFPIYTENTGSNE